MTKKRLNSEIARMVFDLPKFEKYPWGRLAFKQLIESVKRVDYKAQSYTIHGFIQALQIWAYNVVPGLGAKIGRPSNIDGPPLLKFKGTKGKSKIHIHTIVVENEVCIIVLAFYIGADLIFILRYINIGFALNHRVTSKVLQSIIWHPLFGRISLSTKRLMLLSKPFSQKGVWELLLGWKMV